MTPTIGVGMIVRNAEGTLNECLSSFADHVDQIVIVLAGESKDKTEEIARKFTEHVYHFDWIDDFAAARNFAFSFLTTDWFCWFDADDVVEGAENMRQAVIDAEAAGIGCLHFPYVYRSNAQNQPTVEQTRERLVKASLGWAWKYRVHEILVSSTPHSVGKVDNIRVIHKATENHTANYLPILEQMYAEDPNDERTCGILADTYLSMQDFEKGIAMSERAFLMTANEDVKWTHATDLARVYIHQKDWPRAEQWCYTAISLHPEYSLPYLLLASVAWFGYEDSTRALQYIADADAPWRQEAPLHVRRLRDDYTANRWDVEHRCYADQGDWQSALQILQSWARYKGVESLSWSDPLFYHYSYYSERLACEKDVIATEALVDHLFRRGDTLRARKLMEECLPLPIRDDERVVRLYQRVKSLTDHAMGDDDKYNAFYEHYHHDADGHPSETGMNATDIEHYRMDEIISRLKARGAKRVLDVGCGAGEPTLYMAEQGFEVVGLDINSLQIVEARKRAKKRKLKATFEVGSLDTLGPENIGRFDAVIIQEVIEHLPPRKVPLYFAAAEDMLNPGGCVIITTPGMLIGDIPGVWQEFPRDHVQEFSRNDLEKLVLGSASKRVKRIENLYRLYDPKVGLPGFASWFLEWSWCEPEDVGENFDKPVTIYVGPGLEQWNPRTPDEKGLGGSETWAAKTAKELASRGHRVIVYAEAEGVWDGVVYRHYSKFNPQAETWLCIVSRQLSILDERPNAQHVLFVAHDVDYGDELTETRLGNMDKYCVLSQWQEQHTLALYGDLGVNKLAFFSNAIEPEFFNRGPEIAPGKITADFIQDGFKRLKSGEANGADLFMEAIALERVPHSFIWSSSPDRGLDQLLSWWPSIRQLFPGATLNIYYGWDNIDQMMETRPWLQSFKARVTELARQPGVTWHGRIGQRELAQRAMETQFWVYPSRLPEELGGGEWHETFCITALEMQAAGVIPIMAGIGALPERFYFGSMSEGPLTLGYVLDELERLSENGEEWVRPAFDMISADFNWQSATDRLLDIVKEPVVE